MNISGIDHIVVTASDLEKTLHFYVDILGMTPHVAANGQHTARFGNQQINFHNGPAEFMPAAKNPAYGSTDICFVSTGDLEATKKELEEKGVEIELGIVKRNGAKGDINSIYMRDPDGNLVEICVYPE
ncbi:MAG: VOC family protein [Synergistes sp.]|nr:VOC family protein [Synergistes sp.]